MSIQEIIKKKKVNFYLLDKCWSVIQYNTMQEKENKLNDEEWKGLKKWWVN